MTRENVKDLTLLVLVIVTALLLADNICLHCKYAAQRDEIVALEQKLEQHLNPPPEPTIKERAKNAYDKTKAAVKRGYQSVKEKFSDKTKE